MPFRRDASPVDVVAQELQRCAWAYFSTGWESSVPGMRSAAAKLAPLLHALESGPNSAEDVPDSECVKLAGVLFRAIPLPLPLVLPLSQLAAAGRGLALRVRTAGAADPGGDRAARLRVLLEADLVHAAFALTEHRYAEARDALARSSAPLRAPGAATVAHRAVCELLCAAWTRDLGFQRAHLAHLRAALDLLGPAPGNGDWDGARTGIRVLALGAQDASAAGAAGRAPPGAAWLPGWRVAEAAWAAKTLGDTHPAALSAGVFADAAAPDAAARCKRALQAWAALCPPGSAGDLALQAAASAASASGGDCLDLLEGCLAECEAGAGRASATAMRWAAQAAPVALFHAGAAGTEWAARLAKMGRKAVQGRNAEPLGQALLESAAYAACGADTTRSVSFLLDALERELRAMREPGLQANGSLLTAEALRRKAATCCFGTRSEAFSCVKEADDVAARAAGPTSAARMATAWMLLAHVLPPEGFPRRNAGDTLRKIMELAVDLFDELIKAGGEDTPYAAALLAVAGRVLQCSSSADADASFKAALRCTSVSAAKGAYIVAPAVGMGPATPADIEAIVHAWQREGAPALDAPLSPPAALALPGRSNGHATFTAALAFFSANASADNIARAPPLQSHDLFLEHSAPASRPMSASSSQRPSCRPASVTDAAVVADSPRSLAGGVASAARFHMGVSLRSGSRSPAQSWHPGPLRCPSGATTDVLSGPPTRSAHEVDSGGDVCLAGKRAGLSDSPRSMSNAEEMSAKVKTALEGNIPLLHAAS